MCDKPPNDKGCLVVLVIGIGLLACWWLAKLTNHLYEMMHE